MSESRCTWCGMLSEGDHAPNCAVGEAKKLRARNEVLERQLADETALREASTSAARKFEEFMLKEKTRAEQAEQRIAELEQELEEAQNRAKLSETRYFHAADHVVREGIKSREMEKRAEQAEQRIAESHGQEPVAHAWRESCIQFQGSERLTELCGRLSSIPKTVHLYSAPIVPPTVEEAVKDAEEIIAKCRLFLESLPDDLGRGSLNGMKVQLQEAIRARGEK